ncbi:hypothetical protein [Gordonia sp. ABSL49_1]|uniref:hypothetical protein n=1 Tax=Gordonia sp. ABSL49_1 TaxID=2920941 RepID=UPI001F100726|nr:hypothetical protein [Gordonia sp. ABSL49_1]MCH5645144.1 hypothetical protein [Gordonia sp. ABSL49_1]
MTRRIVNRVPTLRPPSRMRHDIRIMGGIDRWFNALVTLYGDYTQAAMAIAYGPGGNGIFHDRTLQIPDWEQLTLTAIGDPNADIFAGQRTDWSLA